MAFGLVAAHFLPVSKVAGATASGRHLRRVGKSTREQALLQRAIAENAEVALGTRGGDIEFDRAPEEMVIQLIRDPTGALRMQPPDGFRPKIADAERACFG